MRLGIYRFSIFGSFLNYAPTTENILKLVGMFSNDKISLLPSIIPENSIQIENGNIPRVVTRNGLELRTDDGKQVIRILSNRIDFEICNSDGRDLDSLFCSLMESQKKMVAILKKILTLVNGNRLAFFIDAFVDDNGKMQDYFEHNNLNLKTILDTNECSEWLHHFNRRGEIKFNNKKEYSNFIVNIERAYYNSENVENEEKTNVLGAHINFDINTVAETINERFDFGDMIHYSEEAQSLMLNVLKQIMSGIN